MLSYDLKPSAQTALNATYVASYSFTSCINDPNIQYELIDCTMLFCKESVKLLHTAKTLGIMVINNKKTADWQCLCRYLTGNLC